MLTKDLEMVNSTNDEIVEGKFQVKNFDEIKSKLEETINNSYTLAEINEDTYSIAKTMKADLNKLAKSLDDKRKKCQKEYMTPFNEGKAQYDILIKIITEASDKLKSGIDSIDSREKEEKKRPLVEYFNIINHFPVRYEQIEDSKWYNKSTKIDSAKADIDSKLKAIEKDIQLVLATIKEKDTQAFVLWRYYNTLDLDTSISFVTSMFESVNRIKENL